MKNVIRTICYVFVAMTALCFNVCNVKKVILPAPLIDFECKPIDGEVMIKNYSGTEKEVCVPQSYHSSAFPITMVGERAFYDNDILTYVVLQNGIKSIGSQAFCNCDNLELIEIPESVTEIKGFAFAGTPWYEKQLEKSGEVIINNIFVRAATDVSEVTIPEEITTIAEFSFGECKKLKKITLPDSVTQIGMFAFASCEGLEEVVLSKNITTLDDGVFGGCVSLEKISIPEGVLSIGDNAFLGCINLKQIEIPESVTSIGTDALLAGLDEMVLYVKENSYALQYAETNGLKYEIQK